MYSSANGSVWTLRCANQSGWINPFAAGVPEGTSWLQFQNIKGFGNYWSDDDENDHPYPYSGAGDFPTMTVHLDGAVWISGDEYIYLTNGGVADGDAQTVYITEAYFDIPYNGSDATAPTVHVDTIGTINSTSAVCNGDVTADGGATVTARGVCWGASANPDLTNHVDAAAGGTGTFTATATGLSASTHYHYRMYATNSAGTSYSADGSFDTGSSGATVSYAIITRSARRLTSTLMGG